MDKVTIFVISIVAISWVPAIIYFSIKWKRDAKKRRIQALKEQKAEEREELKAEYYKMKLEEYKKQ